MGISRRERFEKIAGNRVQFILDKIELLGNCSKTNNYEYSEDDVRKMFTAIKTALKRTEQRFEEGLKKQNKNKFKF